MKAPLNVLGGPLVSCSADPITGWYRDGCCNTDSDDVGSHTICCRLTDQFLHFLAVSGNDLVTPNPDFGFPGLVDGDQWCVCAGSWYQAFQMGVACAVKLESTHAAALEIVPLEAMMQHAIAAEA
jgi:uncharacterized protein (DUF2237 family)